MISRTSSGDFKNITKFLEFMKSGDIFRNLDSYGRQGVDALASATPVETGLTAHSWTYEKVQGKGSYTIYWSNTHEHNGINIAVIIQYGHGTGTGGWVAGRDYINPAIRPVFDRIVDDIWRQVTNG